MESQGDEAEGNNCQQDVTERLASDGLERGPEAVASWASRWSPASSMKIPTMPKMTPRATMPNLPRLSTATRCAAVILLRFKSFWNPAL
jgi:hypothetical protein